MKKKREREKWSRIISMVFFADADIPHSAGKIYFKVH